MRLARVGRRGAAQVEFWRSRRRTDRRDALVESRATSFLRRCFSDDLMRASGINSLRQRASRITPPGKSARVDALPLGRQIQRHVITRFGTTVPPRPRCQHTRDASCSLGPAAQRSERNDAAPPRATTKAGSRASGAPPRPPGATSAGTWRRSWRWGSTPCVLEPPWSPRASGDVQGAAEALATLHVHDAATTTRTRRIAPAKAPPRPPPARRVVVPAPRPRPDPRPLLPPGFSAPPRHHHHHHHHHRPGRGASIGPPHEGEPRPPRGPPAGGTHRASGVGDDRSASSAHQKRPPPIRSGLHPARPSPPRRARGGTSHGDGRLAKLQTLAPGARASVHPGRAASGPPPHANAPSSAYALLFPRRAQHRPSSLLPRVRTLGFRGSARRRVGTSRRAARARTATTARFGTACATRGSTPTSATRASIEPARAGTTGSTASSSRRGCAGTGTRASGATRERWIDRTAAASRMAAAVAVRGPCARTGTGTGPTAPRTSAPRERRRILATPPPTPRTPRGSSLARRSWTMMPPRRTGGVVAAQGEGRASGARGGRQEGTRATKKTSGGGGGRRAEATRAASSSSSSFADADRFEGLFDGVVVDERAAHDRRPPRKPSGRIAFNRYAAMSRGEPPVRRGFAVADLFASDEGPTRSATPTALNTLSALSALSTPPPPLLLLLFARRLWRRFARRRSARCAWTRRGVARCFRAGTTTCVAGARRRGSSRGRRRGGTRTRRVRCAGPSSRGSCRGG